MENTDQVLDAPAFADRKLQYAGFWIRVGAYLIDSLLVGVVNFVIGLALPLEVGYGVSILLGVAYFTILESSTNQATLGKMAVGLKVGDANGGQLSFGNALGRHFAKILSALILCIGFMMVGWDEKNQGLHDKLANTYVFYGK